MIVLVFFYLFVCFIFIPLWNFFFSVGKFIYQGAIGTLSWLLSALLMWLQTASLA